MAKSPPNDASTPNPPSTAPRADRPVGPRPAIHLATPGDHDAIVRHWIRHMSENGNDGGPYFAPFSRETDYQDRYWEDREKRIAEWAQPVSADAPASWERVWFVRAGEADPASPIVAHLDLKQIVSPRSAAGIHRAMLGMGIEKPERGKGLGGALLEAALAWARAQPSLDWIDLRAMAGNDGALALYRKYGFQVDGVKRDLFRFDGRSFDDAWMSLKLRD